MITAENWRVRMTEDMRLHDLRGRTVGAYTLAVRLFLERLEKAPEDTTEDDIRKYVLHLRDERLQAPSSINIAVCALRFFFTRTLQREYDVFDLMVQDILGHGSLRTTEVYMHVTLPGRERVQEVVDVTNCYWVRPFP